MKKITYLLVVLSSVLLFSCGKKTVIEGVISDADSCKLVLENFNAGKPQQLKELVLDKGGKFSFSVPALDSTEVYNLLLDKNKVVRLVVKPEEKITVKATKATFGKNYQISGSEESKLLQEAEGKLWQTRKDLNQLREKYKTAKTADEKKDLETAYQKRFAKHHDYLRHFVFDNASSLVAYLALYQKVDAENFVFGALNDDKYVRAVAQKVKMGNPSSPYLPLLMKELENRKKQKQNLQVVTMLEQMENSYPELNLKDANGKDISLKVTKGKYALLWFGVLNEASKNTLLPIYKKYAQRGLAIYFVDENQNETIWEQAVKDLHTPWINVRDNGLAARMYNVQRVPANYIIDLDGTIEGKDLFGSYLTEKLDKLL